MTASVSFRNLLLTIVVVALAACAWAQTPTGTISGVVSDSSGAVVTGANVTVANINTGLTRQSATNQDGIYGFTALPLGRYTVTVEKAGFTTVVKEGLVLEVDQRLRSDFRLEVGAAKENVTVTAEAQLLKQDTSEVGQIINEKVVGNLPVNGRQFWQLALLTPGVSSGPPNRPGPALGWNDISANGQREDSNLFLLDGFDNRDMDLNQDSSPPNFDAIAEFAVHTNTYSAAEGAASGAVVNVVTKSGTNNFHGSAFEYFRNDALDANNFFAIKNHVGKSPLRFNQFGGTIGGPIVRNRTFFFAEYEGNRVSRGSPLTTTVPTLAWRAGDFSDFGVPLLNPRTFAPIAGNQITPAMMDPIAAQVVNMLPKPNLPGSRLNYTAMLTNTLRRDSFSVKVDHAISSKNNLTVRFAYFNQLTDNPPLFGAAAGGPSFSGLAGTDANKRNSIHISDVHTFSENFINDFRVGWNWGTRRLLNADYNLDTSNQLGMPNITISPFTKGLTHFLFNGGGIADVGSSFAMPQFLGLVNYQFRDTVSLVRGKHHIQVGGDVIRRHFNMFQTLFPRGLYVFLGLSSLLTTGQALPGADFADFLLGAPVAVQRDYLNGGARGMRGFNFDLFVQDDYKVTPRLTLNLGARYDLYKPWVEVNNRIANFDPSTRTLVQPGGKFGDALVPTDRNNISPRIGFSYALTSDAKTLVRGGFGMFYFDLQNGSGTFSKLVYNPPGYFFQRGPNFPFAPSLAAGFPIATFPSVSDPTGTVVYQPQSNVTTYAEEWNLNVQRALPGEFVLEVGYVGTRALHLPGLLNLNQPMLDSSGNTVRPFGTDITGLKTWTTSFGSNYHALQLKAERRFSKGFQMLSTYTFSKTLDDASGLMPNPTDETVAQNSYDIRAEYGPATIDVRHRFTLSAIYELPFLAKSENKVLKTAFGGWQVNGIVTVNSGVPFTPIIQSGVAGNANPLFSDPSVTDGGNMRPNVIGNPVPSGFQQNEDHWFDPSAFDYTFTGQPHNVALFGNAGRNSLRAPGYASTDVSFFKTFPLTEAVHMQFRSELFNVLNRTNFDPPARIVSQPEAGRITSARPGREVQFALRFTF